MTEHVPVFVGFLLYIFPPVLTFGQNVRKERASLLSAYLQN